ncbi:MAG TPA: SRPBCC family protein, partial [Thermoanaerobaculia bacterium]|nr:SRPBCC family protein [Thermoanaerobaculia bacterium]
FTENGGILSKAMLGGGKEALTGGSVAKGLFKGGASGVMDKVKGLFGGGKGGGQKKATKATNIVETIDVGVPIQVAYNQWTQFQDFSGFMKKVESVEQESDEKNNWKAQVFWSHRSWEATTQEQVADDHIIWRSKGAKGYVDGAVTFSELAPNLTRISLVMEYHPQGLFEHTGNLWRAQGRRARLEFKHFRRHVMVHSVLKADEIEGWRGEIREGEVVKTHDEAIEEEERAREEEPEAREEEEPREEEEGRGEEEEAGGEEEEPEEGAEEGEEGEEPEEGEQPEEPEEEPGEAAEAEEPEGEPEEEPEERPRRRRRAAGEGERSRVRPSRRRTSDEDDERPRRPSRRRRPADENEEEPAPARRPRRRRDREEEPE